MAIVDLTGTRFNRWLVVCLSRNTNHVLFWNCVCDCGSQKEVFGGDLKRGKTQSCGCLMKEAASVRSFKHGKARHRLYSTWIQMRHRCDSPEYDGYHLYGGRGISYCNDWDNFETFLAEMEPTWAAGLTLDRVDVNGNYNKANCRWATARQQANNRRTNRVIETPDGSMTVADAARHYGINAGTIHARLRYGWTDPHQIIS